MAVIVGSARIDENGHAHGGKAGDQTGKEVSTQNWYLHSKGWRVFRAKEPAAQEKIAKCMQAACNSKHIGYDQYQRNTLYTEASKFGFDVSKVTKDVETDCSALVRVCCAYAGIMGLPSDFRTGNMPANLMATGKFVEMKDAKYTTQSAYLRRGDILVTKTNGHTVVALSNGSKADKDTNVPVKLGDRDLKKGCEGDDVKALQLALLAQGYPLPKYGADGDFGAETQKAVKAWQKDRGKTQSGALTAAECLEVAGAGRHVTVTGALVNVRSAPSMDGRVLGTVKKGDRLPYQGESKADARGVSWHLVEYMGENGWISEKFGKVE